MRTVGAVGAVLVCFVGCVGDSSTPVDGGSDTSTNDVITVESGADVVTTDAPSDAPKGPCNLGKPFNPPQAVTELNSTSDESGLRLSPDLLTAYFSSSRNGEPHLFVANRANTGATFGNITQIPIVNQNGSGDSDPSVTGDGLTLYFWSTRSGGPDPINNVMKATRTSTTTSFGAPAFDTSIDKNGFSTAGPFVKEDGSQLFHTAFDNGSTGSDIYVAGSKVTELSSASYDEYPTLTPDGLTIFFSSTRSGSQGGSRDIWTATRTSPTAAFVTPTIVTELNSSKIDDPSFVSADGCTIWLSSDRATGNGRDFYVASRPVN